MKKPFKDVYREVTVYSPSPSRILFLTLKLSIVADHE